MKLMELIIILFESRLAVLEVEVEVFLVPIWSCLSRFGLSVFLVVVEYYYWKSVILLLSLEWALAKSFIHLWCAIPTVLIISCYKYFNRQIIFIIDESDLFRNLNFIDTDGQPNRNTSISTNIHQLHPTITSAPRNATPNATQLPTQQQRTDSQQISTFWI